MVDKITGYTELLGIVANPIKHSASPIMHNAACKKLGLDYVYLAFEVTPDTFDDAIKGLKAMNCKGFNISMPYKQTIIPYLDTLSKRSQLCGAVNTVVNKEGVFHGDITDGPGFMMGLKDKGWDVIGKKITMIGAGGAAFAIMVEAAMDGVKEIVVYKRKNATYEQVATKIQTINQEINSNIILKALGDTGALKKDIQESYLLVNASSVGMKPLEGKSCIPDVTYLHKGLKVADIIYSPLETELLLQAKKSGLEYINGQRMILFQGALSFEQWTKKQMPIEYMKEILEIV